MSGRHRKKGGDSCFSAAAWRCHTEIQGYWLSQVFQWSQKCRWWCKISWFLKNTVWAKQNTSVGQIWPSDCQFATLALGKTESRLRERRVTEPFWVWVWVREWTKLGSNHSSVIRYPQFQASEHPPNLTFLPHKTTNRNTHWFVTKTIPDGHPQWLAYEKCLIK